MDIKSKSIWMGAGGVRIWALLPNTVEYPQHIISIPPRGFEPNFKNPWTIAWSDGVTSVGDCKLLVEVELLITSSVLITL